jgi:hypothetical protein
VRRLSAGLPPWHGDAPTRMRRRTTGLSSRPFRDRAKHDVLAEARQAAFVVLPMDAVP